MSAYKQGYRDGAEDRDSLVNECSADKCLDKSCPWFSAGYAEKAYEYLSGYRAGQSDYWDTLPDVATACGD